MLDKPVEVTQQDLEALAKLIVEGFTNGRLDCGEGKHITWSITTEAWED